MPPGDALQLSLDASPASMEHARRQLLEHLGPDAALAANRRAVYALELVLEEWLTNVFRHSGSSRVDLLATRQVGQLTLQFTDFGMSFDPTARADPPRPASLDDAQPGGLGLFFIHQYSRAWRYSRDQGRNVMQVVIEFVTQPSSSAPPG